MEILTLVDSFYLVNQMSIYMSSKELSDIRRKLRIIQHGQESGNVSKTCRYFGISRETYYKWKKDYESEGESAL